jgi:hypothetical protein
VQSAVLIPALARSSSGGARQGEEAPPKALERAPAGGGRARDPGYVEV